jgi:hypothetical protein
MSMSHERISRSLIRPRSLQADCDHPGMAQLPKVVSPLVPVLERDGVELVLVSVEAWPDEVVVRMRGLPSRRTAELEAAFEEALHEWGRDPRSEPPTQPGERVFDLDVRLADALDTAYSPSSSARGGTGTMFRADWTFRPGPPPEVDRLVVRIRDAAPVTVDLA